jgi:deoxyribodipyrimidine photo-lyase
LDTALVLFTRDLRVHDNPALTAAVEEARRIVPLFVFDDTILQSAFACPNRVSFLVDSVHDLDKSLKARGAGLVVRRGDVVTETMRLVRQCNATALHIGADYSSYARRREQRLAKACKSMRCKLTSHEGLTIVPPGAVTPQGADHFRVFTPYWRRWRELPPRAPAPTPRRLSGLPKIRTGVIPKADRLVRGRRSPELAPGGETPGRKLMQRWLRTSIEDYERAGDNLAEDRTSRLSAYLRFGCISALELMNAAESRPGNEPFVRQLCWRDFFHQVLAAFEELPRRDYRPRGDRWSRSTRLLEAWKLGRTGYPIVDAGMRQLAEEGFMHNRARLITASFLTKTLYLDWRAGADHYWQLLADGDIANNAGNWQWVAGTGNDTRPNRVLNPLRQAKRYDPEGDYVRRYVPELGEIEGKHVHEPWKLGPRERRGLDYPQPIVDFDEARLRRKRSR